MAKDVVHARGDEDGAGSTAGRRGPRQDLLIAVCALLISCLASAASWWQARLLSEQTRVLQEQLGAQVWPYVDTPETIDNARVTIAVTNSGLGPAVIRSVVVRVDGQRQPSMVAVVHRILGQHLVARTPRGERTRIALYANVPGSVLRAGQSTALLTLTSTIFAAPFVRASPRISIAVCYCAIVPGQCWSSDSASNADPLPLRKCEQQPYDLLRAVPLDVLNRNF